jgi:Second Messenger Oligonucleotide or Dinucleotide Synthetase domain
MGGSGGDFPSWKETEDIRERVQREIERTKDSALETEINALINDRLKDFNERDVEQINQHLDAILGALNKEIDGSVQTNFGGSVSKHTYVDGLSDIDVLMTLNNSELKLMSPKEVNEYFVKRLQERLPKTDIKSGQFAVTVTFSDGAKIQILPSIRTETGVKIAQASGEKWSKVVKPQKFAEKLIKANQNCANKVVPVIKLVKAINSELQPSRQLSGYHIESLAVQIFSKYDGLKTTKAMLKHFIHSARKDVLKPISDKTGQSIHVDDNLGSANSVERKAISDTLSRIVRRIESADRSGSIKQWENLI